MKYFAHMLEKHIFGKQRTTQNLLIDSNICSQALTVSIFVCCSFTAMSILEIDSTPETAKAVFGAAS